mmetsp:Transcript_24440/g.73348  ORF Transcript_24440/g.73348 Transcript_24440/m.73348 type:complete len:222 (-) Transcript_24440:30-695(-)
MAQFQSSFQPGRGTGAGYSGGNPDIYAEDYDWVINKLRARGFKTVQDRRAEAEEQRKARLAAWEAEKARRYAAGESQNQQGDDEKNPSWWKDMKQLPGYEREDKPAEKPYELMTDEEKEEKKIRDKWGGTLAESVPISDLKMLNSKGYIPRSQATCFRCGEKGHWSRDCPQSAKNQMQQRGEEEGILNRNRSELRGRDARMYDKALMEKRERQHFGGRGGY